jgi:predicted RNase H-like HicB family nuclease
MMPTYNVKAEWDGEANVWVASSDDVPGLATGADTFEELIEKLKVVIPELLEENGLWTGASTMFRSRSLQSVSNMPAALLDGRQLHAAGQGYSNGE